MNKTYEKLAPLHPALNRHARSAGPGWALGVLSVLMAPTAAGGFGAYA
jgi:hypothetical protein